MGIKNKYGGKCLGRLVRKSAAVYEPLENRTMFSAVVVNSILDQLDPVGSNTVTLRDAIAIANASTTPTTITFDSNVFATEQTIKLDGSRLIIKTQADSDTVSITAPSSGLIINGNHKSGDFVVWSNTTASLNGFTLTGGKSGNGAGVDSYGNVTVTNTTITGNMAPNGGGVYSSGSATFTDDTISNNIGVTGGGIWNSDGGHLTLTDVTLSANTAKLGGGIYNGGAGNGTTTMTNCTVAGNTASLGGGVYNFKGGTVNVASSIIATNKRVGGKSGNDVSGVFSSQGLNLIGNADDSSGWISTDQTGTTAHPLNPKLNTLASNGGATQTITLQPGSPALGGASETPSTTTATTTTTTLPVPTVLGPGATSTAGSVTDSNTPTFTWDAVTSGLTGYQLNLYNYTNKAFVSYQIDASATSFTVPTALPSGDSFVWNLRVVNGTTTGTESAYLYFQTPAAPAPVTLPVPTVLGPGTTSTPGSVTTSTTPTFTWDAVPSTSTITGYQLNLYNNTTKAFVSYQISADATSFTVPTALPNGDSFVWNLRVVDGTTTGQESAYLNFQTPAAVAPTTLPVPTVLGPGATSTTDTGTVSTTPTFTWDAVSPSPAITGYQLNLYNYTTKAFVSYQISASATSFTLPTALPSGDSFVWNLRVVSGSTTGTESAYLNFQT